MVIPSRKYRGRTVRAKESERRRARGGKGGKKGRIWKAPIPPLERGKSYLTWGRNSDATSARLRRWRQCGNTRAPKVHEERAKDGTVSEAARGKPTPVDARARPFSAPSRKRRAAPRRLLWIHPPADYSLRWKRKARGDKKRGRRGRENFQDRTTLPPPRVFFFCPL